MESTELLTIHSQIAYPDRYRQNLIELARNCRSNGYTQQALEIAAHLAYCTSSPEDFAFMRRCVEQLMRSTQTIYADTAAKVALAYVNGMDFVSAKNILSTVHSKEIGPKIAATWTHMYSKTRDREYLETARTLTERMRFPEHRALAYANIYALGCEDRDMDACHDILATKGWHAIRLQETKASIIVDLARNGLVDDARLLFGELTFVHARLRAATAIAMDTRDRDQMNLTVRLARKGIPFKFAEYRRLIRMVAACGDEKVLASLCDEDRRDADNPAEQCFALSFLAVISQDRNERLNVLEDARSIANTLQGRTETENAPMALAAFAWAQAFCGEYEFAPITARLIRTPMHRCIAYLAIADAEADLETIYELGI